MNNAAKRFCNYFGCGVLVDNGYCEKHRKSEAQRQYQADKEHRGQYDRRWRSFRLSYLREHPLCVDCQQANKMSPAYEVHHIKKLRDYPDLKFDDANLMGLCKPCHSIRTARGE